MAHRFTIRQVGDKRGEFGTYVYEILDVDRLIAHNWHDYRGNEHGIDFTDGRSHDWPVGCMIDFVNGGGPVPLTLSLAATEWLVEQLRE